MPSPMFIRVKDSATGHEFDRREDDPGIASGRFVPVKTKQYPPAPVARRPKHHVKLAGRTASRETTSPQVTSEAPEKENHDG